jgi:hypothetical protein
MPQNFTALVHERLRYNHEVDVTRIATRETEINDHGMGPVLGVKPIIDGLGGQVEVPHDDVWAACGP